ncbi:MAG: ABC transporter ATP-binding protein [Acidobacteriota bacterium]
MRASAAVTIDSLSKTYPAPRGIRDLVLHPLREPSLIPALEDITLEVQRGEVFGLLGPNGAGKTTLLKLLACLVLPTSGSATVNGYSILGEEQRVKASIGYVTADERSFYWRLSGRENLRFFAKLYGLEAGRLEPRCVELLERVEIGADQADERFMFYSSGVRQRLAVARALLHDPPILFMDEPTRSLDPLTARHLRDFIRDVLVREDGKTVLLCTHNLHEAEDLCARVGVLVRGRLRHIASPAALRFRSGAGAIYRLQLEGVAASKLEEHWDARCIDGRLHVEIREDRPGGLDAILRKVHGAGGRVMLCERVEASLEDVFNQLCEAEESPSEDAAAPGARPGSDKAAADEAERG